MRVRHTSIHFVSACVCSSISLFLLEGGKNLDEICNETKEKTFRIIEKDFEKSHRILGKQQRLNTDLIWEVFLCSAT